MPPDKQPPGNRPTPQENNNPAIQSDRQGDKHPGFTHGLCSVQIVMPWESREEFESFHAVMLARLTPETPTELLFSERAILDAWRLRRVALYLAKLAKESRDLYKVIDVLERISRYEGSFMRSMQRALDELKRHKQVCRLTRTPAETGKSHWFFTQAEIQAAQDQANQRHFWKKVARLTPPTKHRATHPPAMRSTPVRSTPPARQKKLNATGPSKIITTRG